MQECLKDFVVENNWKIITAIHQKTTISNLQTYLPPIQISLINVKLCW